jgi:hypothetical protein
VCYIFSIDISFPVMHSRKFLSRPHSKYNVDYVIVLLPPCELFVFSHSHSNLGFSNNIAYLEVHTKTLYNMICLLCLKLFRLKNQCPNFVWTEMSLPGMCQFSRLIFLTETQPLIISIFTKFSASLSEKFMVTVRLEI